MFTELLKKDFKQENHCNNLAVMLQEQVINEQALLVAASCSVIMDNP